MCDKLNKRYVLEHQLRNTRRQTAERFCLIQSSRRNHKSLEKPDQEASPQLFPKCVFFLLNGSELSSYPCSEITPLDAFKYELLIHDPMNNKEPFPRPMKAHAGPILIF